MRDPGPTTAADRETGATPEANGAATPAQPARDRGLTRQPPEDPKNFARCWSIVVRGLRFFTFTRDREVGEKPSSASTLRSKWSVFPAIVSAGFGIG